MKNSRSCDLLAFIIGVWSSTSNEIAEDEKRFHIDHPILLYMLTSDCLEALDIYSKSTLTI